jgi:hypothetical protein
MTAPSAWKPVTRAFAVNGAVALVHLSHLDSCHRNGDYCGVWLRSTVCCQPIDNKWLITHEHISLPLDWAKSGIVVTNLTPHDRA